MSTTVAQAFPSAATYVAPRPGGPEARLIESALDLFARRPYREVLFRDVIQRSGVNRATAYRLHPGGLDSLIESIHRATVHHILETTLAYVTGVPSTRYQDVLRAGIAGALRGLTEAPWTGSVLWRDRDLLTAYLLNRGDGTVFSTLAHFASWCATKRGADEAVVYPFAEEVVWEVFAAALRGLSDHPNEPPDWPADTSDPRLIRVVNRFIRQSGVSRGSQSGPILATDLFSAPPSRPIVDSLDLALL